MITDKLQSISRKRLLKNNLATMNAYAVELRDLDLSGVD